MKPFTILIADDEENVRKLLSLILEENEYQVIWAENGLEAIQKFQQNAIDLVLLDIRMPEMDGLQALKELKTINQEIPIILMTAYAGVDTAVEALQMGAFDYIIKPFDLEDMLALINKALQPKLLHNDNKSYMFDQIELYDDEGKSQKLLTNSPVMMELCRNIAKISQTNATVLITGESGTGKELIAKLIHYYSKRTSSPFIKVNCGALPETLLESTLFGHEKGAFTGAQNKQIGLFKRVDQGTLLLDEVGEMSTSLQVKLLRVLQEKEFEPIGSHTTISTDFRLIAATNRNLQEMVENNIFRLDLFYRLNVMSLHIPPLRERPEDIVLLAQHFIQKFCIEHHRNALNLTDETISLLNNYSWPGNVRELSNAIEHAVIMATGTFIHPEDLPKTILSSDKTPSTTNSNTINNGDDALSGQTLREAIKNYEKELITQALKQHNGNREKTAKALGLSKRALMYKIQEFQVDV